MVVQRFLNDSSLIFHLFLAKFLQDFTIYLQPAPVVEMATKGFNRHRVKSSWVAHFYITWSVFVTFGPPSKSTNAPKTARKI